MRNKIITGCKHIPAVPLFKDLEIGTLFRYKMPWSEDNIYMKIDKPNSYHCVHLNTGIVYTVQHDREVVPLNDETIKISID